MLEIDNIRTPYQTGLLSPTACRCACCWTARLRRRTSAALPAGLSVSWRPRLEGLAPSIVCQPARCLGAQVRLLLAGKPVLPAECAMHPGRKACKVERMLAA